jgi:UDPglucose 6-dehydrogenase
VYGFENDITKLNFIRQARIPFLEPQLGNVLRRNLGKNFILDCELRKAVENSRFIFFCVGTPGDSKGNADLRLLKKAISQVLKCIPKDTFKVLVIKSTIPPTTSDKILKPFIEGFGFTVGKNIGLVHNPEFLREGHAWQDFMSPDRLVIGQSDEKSGLKLEKLYKPFKAPVFRVSLNTAEFVKYLSNTFLGTLISFYNEMSMMADKFGDVNISKTFKILHADKRWFGSPASMTSYVYPGCGFGGYCLPKDTEALRMLSMKIGYKPRMLDSVVKINKSIKEFWVDRILAEVKKSSRIGILGLSFKPDSDDVRQSPSKDIIKILLRKGYKRIVAYDPEAMDNFRKFNLKITYANCLPELISKSDCLLLLTAWDEFKREKEVILKKKLFDLRYVFKEV